MLTIEDSLMLESLGNFASPAIIPPPPQIVPPPPQPSQVAASVLPEPARISEEVLLQMQRLTTDATSQTARALLSCNNLAISRTTVFLTSC